MSSHLFSIMMVGGDNRGDNVPAKRLSQKAISYQSAKQPTADRLYNKIQEEVLSIINDLVAKNGYDVIFEWGKSGMIYFSSSIDITNSLIGRYNKTK
jgi:Skp family chaperone for outer membrane proteins